VAVEDDVPGERGGGGDEQVGDGGVGRRSSAVNGIVPPCSPAVLMTARRRTPPRSPFATNGVSANAVRR
jgi:hypothetical protein